MRAAAADKFGDISELKIQDVPKPVAAADQILVNVRAAAVNPADLKVLNHNNGGSFLHASVFPLILGYDFSGVVAELGATAAGHKVGDEVYGFLPYARATQGGTYAEFVAVGATTVGPKPKSVTHEQAAAAATSAATALQALRDHGKLVAGQRVLVNGASGGTGSYAVQIAKAMGATVSATSSAGKVAHVQALGADRVYDYRATPLERIDETFDIVLDCAATSSFGVCEPLIGKGGAFITLLPSPSLYLNKVRCWFSSKRCGWLQCQPLTADFTQISEWIDAGKITSAVDATFMLSELPKALELLVAGGVRGKIAVTI